MWEENSAKIILQRYERVTNAIQKDKKKCYSKIPHFAFSWFLLVTRTPSLRNDSEFSDLKHGALSSKGNLDPNKHLGVRRELSHKFT